MKKGFTLIELLVVVGVIGILATVLFGNLSGTQKISRANEAKAEVNKLAIEYESYLATHPSFAHSGTTATQLRTRTAIEEPRVPQSTNIVYTVRFDKKKYAFCASGSDLISNLPTGHTHWIATSKSSPQSSTACPSLASL